MDIRQTIQEAGVRFQNRDQERKQRLRLAKEKGIQAVETEERIQTRGILLNMADATALEAVIGGNDLLLVNYFEKGMSVSRSICRLRVRVAPDSWSGTGWMVSPNLLITNNHVLSSQQEARGGLADFNYEEDANLSLRVTFTFRLLPEKFFYTSPALDFTLVAVDEEATTGNGMKLSDFGHLQLIAQSGKALLGESLSIIQHPGGDTKHIALRNNQLIDIFQDFAHYSTDTKKGSSGSPVFNDAWQIVALHHAGIPRLDKKGRWLAIGGRLWKQSMGEDVIDWVANEGIRISSIFAHLKAKGDWTSGEEALLEEMGVAFS